MVRTTSSPINPMPEVHVISPLDALQVAPTMEQLCRLADDYRSAAQQITRQHQSAPTPASPTSASRWYAR